MNNLIAVLESDEVISHIVNDEKNQLEFKSLYSKKEKNIFKIIFTKKITINKDYIKNYHIFNDVNYIYKTTLHVFQNMAL